MVETWERLIKLFGIRGEQKTFEVGGVKIGGQPGENPTVLIGSIFYRGQKIVKDETDGTFDRKQAEDLINRQDQLAEETGNPCMIDVVGVSEEALRKYLDFVSAHTDVPILLDGGTSANNIAGLQYANESGLIERIVYNSLVPECKQAEIDKIKGVALRSAVLLALNSRDFTARGRVTAIDDLLKRIDSAGIEKPLLDTCVLDMPTLGQACQAIVELKSKYGLPAGCGAHNAVSTWKTLKPKFGGKAVEPCTASADILAIAAGADFILYGPIGTADYVFPAVGMVNAAFAQIAMERGVKIDKTHPRFRVAQFRG